MDLHYHEVGTNVLTAAGKYLVNKHELEMNWN